MTSCVVAKYGFTRKLIDSNSDPVANAKIYFIDKKGDTIRSTVSDENGSIKFEGRGNIKKIEKYTFRYSIVKSGYDILVREDQANLVPDSLVLRKKDEL